MYDFFTWHFKNADRQYIHALNKEVHTLPALNNMTDRIHKISQLIIKFLEDNLTEQEQHELDSWINESSENSLLFKQLTDPTSLLKELSIYDELVPDKTEPQAPAPKTGFTRLPVFKKRTWGYITGITAMLALAYTIWALSHKPTNPSNITASHISPPVVKKGKVALILADNRVINLDTAYNGPVLEQDNLLITKHEKSLIYNNRNSRPANASVYNTVSTKRGAKFKVTLPDGSTAWLNDSSSIEFPVTFSSEKRQVSITGEVCFEVVSLNFPDNTNEIPFIVTVKTPFNKTFDVEVVGTQFNINAYGDLDVIKTTVQKGAVKVISGPNIQEVKKGEGATFTAEGKIELFINKDPDATISWRDSIMKFVYVPVKEVLRKLERCYDVQITYLPDSNAKPYFNGKIPTNQKIEDVLALIKDQCRGTFIPNPMKK